MTVFGMALCGASPAAWAKANGIASGGCLGCHKGPAPMVSITVEPMVPAPGGTSGSAFGGAMRLTQSRHCFSVKVASRRSKASVWVT